jgi:N-acyl homoserine lactone hydrolase
MKAFRRASAGRRWPKPAPDAGKPMIDENFNPPREIRAMEMEVIPPGTSVNTYEAYDIMLEIKQMADLLIPLHEPRFAGGSVIG